MLSLVAWYPGTDPAARQVEPALCGPSLVRSPARCYRPYRRVATHPSFL